MNIAIEPHSDDVFLGCYSLLKLGLINKVITVSDGGTVPEGVNIEYEDYIDIRYRETVNFREMFNLGGSYLWYDDGELDKDFTKIQEEISNYVKPGDTIFLPSYSEKHPDHKTISKLIFPDCNVIEYSISTIPDNLEGFTFTQFRFKEKMKLFKKLYPSQYESLRSSNYDFLECEYFRVRK